MKIERDNFGRLVVRDMGGTFYLTADGRVMLEYTTDRVDRAGVTWYTKRHRQVTGPRADRVRALLERGAIDAEH